MFFNRGLFFQGLRMLKEATRGGPAWVDTRFLGWINKQKSDHVWWNLKCNLIICWFSFDMLLQVKEEQLPGHDRWLGRMEKFCCCNKVQDIMLFEFPSSHWMHLFWLFFSRNFGQPGATIRYLAAAGWSDAGGRAGVHSPWVLCVIISALLLYIISESYFSCVIAFNHPSHCACVAAWLWCLLWQILAMQSAQLKFCFQAASLLLISFTRTQSNSRNAVWQ